MSGASTARTAITCAIPRQTSSNASLTSAEFAAAAGVPPWPSCAARYVARDGDGAEKLELLERRVADDIRAGGAEFDDQA